MNKKIVILSLLLLAAIILAGGVFWYTKDKLQPSVNQPVINEVANTNQPVTDKSYEIIPPTKTDCTDELDTACWNTYRNNEYGFEFRYPGEWRVLNLYKDKVSIFWTNNETEDADMIINVTENKEMLGLLDYHDNNEMMYNFVKLSDGKFRYIKFGNLDGIDWNLNFDLVWLNVYSVQFRDKILQLTIFNKSNYKDMVWNKIDEGLLGVLLDSFMFI